MKEETKTLITEIMNEDAKDGLYREDDVEKLLEIVKGSKIDINEIAVPNETIDKYKLFLAGYNYAKENTYTEEQVEYLVKKIITETANAYLEWIKNETDIIDKETKLVISNAELDIKKDSKSLFNYIHQRLEKQGIKVNHPIT